MYPIQKIRSHFPILTKKIHGKQLVYFDNASTTQKPQIVLHALLDFYTNWNANIHRGVHTLSEHATELYENARSSVAEFIHADTREIVFTKSCTESINLVARSWGYDHIKKNDEIMVSILEHHANLVCWQSIAKEKKARLISIPLRDDYSLDYDFFLSHLSRRTKLVCITAQSNVLGIKPPITKMIQAAHHVGARVLIDGAQYIAHEEVDVKKLNCDFFTFSAHKMLGPTGVGVLYGKKELLESMRPFLYGGDMIASVKATTSTYREAPWKFEAGTPNIADVIAFPKALDFLQKIGFDRLKSHEEALSKRVQEVLGEYKEVKPFCQKNVYSNIVSFMVQGVHPHDIATVFDAYGIAIRSGAHCAEPLMKYLKIPATARISLYLYNTLEECDKIHFALRKVIKTFA